MRLLCALLAALSSQQAAAATFDCFTVIDPQGEVVYKSHRTPVDLSKNISEAMSADFPGHHLIWSQTEDVCIGVNKLPSRDAPAASPQPASASQDADASAKPGRKAATARATLRRRQATG